MRKTVALLVLSAVLLLSGCGSSVLDDDGTKHVTFVNGMNCIVTSVEVTLDGTESSNLLSENTQLKQGDRTILKIPVENESSLSQAQINITDTAGAVYHFSQVDLKNAGTMTFKLDGEGDATVVVGS